MKSKGDADVQFRAHTWSNLDPWRGIIFIPSRSIYSKISSKSGLDWRGIVRTWLRKEGDTAQKLKTNQTLLSRLQGSTKSFSFDLWFFYSSAIFHRVGTNFAEWNPKEALLLSVYLFCYSYIEFCSMRPSVFQTLLLTQFTIDLKIILWRSL